MILCSKISNKICTSELLNCSNSSVLQLVKRDLPCLQPAGLPLAIDSSVTLSQCAHKCYTFSLSNMMWFSWETQIYAYCLDFMASCCHSLHYIFTLAVFPINRIHSFLCYFTLLLFFLQSFFIHFNEILMG